MIALGSAAGFGACYVLIAWGLHARLSEQGKIIARNQTSLVQILQEGLGGIRDVLLDSTQGFYATLYRKTDRPLRVAQGNNLFMSGAPRYLIESLGMIFIAGLAFGLSQKGGLATALPVLGALALGVQRMLPALQQGYNSWSLLVGNQAALADILGFLEQPLSEKTRQTKKALPFHDTIMLRDISFRYGPELPVVLTIPSLTIPKGACVGIVGETGCGKSTFLDLIMGLLTPSKGGLFVDGRLVQDAAAWQKNIAHVPQAIYLADSSIAENIAFGIPREEIDLVRVRKAARQANIAETIESLPEGYDTKVGERGVRLSGGQRQRIGIARALYKEASLLILDEATSALDSETERAVMEEVEKLRDDLTILIVAHRTSTLDSCDFVLKVAQGTIQEQ
jgi:ATP-binding cassette subfamily B protein